MYGVGDVTVDTLVDLVPFPVVVTDYGPVGWLFTSLHVPSWTLPVTLLPVICDWLRYTVTVDYDLIVLPGHLLYLVERFTVVGRFPLIVGVDLTVN